MARAMAAAAMASAMAWVYSVIVTATELSSCSNVREIRDYEKVQTRIFYV
jgi:hypothetical protein